LFLKTYFKVAPLKIPLKHR